jgi:hypothetical protein
MNKRPELDTKNPPGQIVNPIPKQECEKLTFEEWWNINGIGGRGLYEIAKEAWNAAKENK